MSAAIFRQAELPFSEEDKVQMLRDDNRHLKEENAALREEIERMRRMLFGSSSEKMEKGDWMVTVEEPPLPEEPKEEPKKATETGKKAEGKTERKPRLKVHVTRRVWHELLPEEVKAEPEKYQRLPKSCDVVSHRIEKVPAHLHEEIYVCPRFVRSGVAGKNHPRESARDNPARLDDGSKRGGDGHPRQVRTASAALPADQGVRATGHRRAQRRRDVQLDACRSRCHGAAVEGDARAAAGKPGAACGRNSDV